MVVNILCKLGHIRCLAMLHRIVLKQLIAAYLGCADAEEAICIADALLGRFQLLINDLNNMGDDDDDACQASGFQDTKQGYKNEYISWICPDRSCILCHGELCAFVI